MNMLAGRKKESCCVCCCCADEFLEIFLFSFGGICGVYDRRWAPVED